MIYRLARLVALIGIGLGLHGASQSEGLLAAVGPQWNHSNDTDGLRIDKWAASGFTHYQSGQQWRGVELQQQQYRQNANALDGQSVSYVAQNIDPVSGMGYNYKAGWNQGLGASLLTAEANWNQAYSPSMQWGLFASRDWVESFAALQNKVHYDLVGGSVDYQFHPRVTAVASLAQTHFSDGANRQQQRMRWVWDALPEHGVTLQWAYKHQLGEKDASPRLYFNPEQLDESITFIGWRKRLEGWQMYARAGWGTQKVTGLNTSPARVTELNLSSPVRGEQFFKFRLGTTETVGINGAGYVYRFADVQWVFRLNH